MSRSGVVPRGGLAALAALSFLGCAAPRTEVRPAPPPPARADRLAMPLRDAGWGWIVSPRFFVELPLPEAASWRVDDASGRWLEATHVPSKSLILVRGWRAESLVTHARCEAEARRWRPDLFGRTEEAITDRRPLGAPAGFDTEVGFTVHRKGDALGGVVVAVGANLRRCLVAVYVTREDGPGAAEAVAERLAFVAERVFARITARTVEDRARDTTKVNGAAERAP